MEIKKVDEKFPGISPASSGLNDGLSVAALTTWLAIDMINWKKITKGTAALWGSAIAGLGLVVGVMRYNADKKTENQYEAAARSNNAAIDAVIQLKAENEQLRGSLEVERQRFTDVITSKHVARGEHREHAEHAGAAGEHAHATHAEKHEKHHSTHAEKAMAEKQEAAEAQLSV